MQPPASAIALHVSASKAYHLTAKRLFRQTEVDLNNFALFESDGAPLCLAFARGASPDEKIPFFSRHVRKSGAEHCVEHDDQATIRQALGDNKKILLSPNPKTFLPRRDLKFQAVDSDFSRPFKTWIAENYKNYIRVPVDNIDQAIAVIHTARAQGINRAAQVSLIFRGSVLPYDAVYLSKKKGKMVRLFDDLMDKRGGTAQTESKILGTVCIARFAPTQSTIKNKGTRGLRGNHFVRFDGHKYGIYGIQLHVTKSAANKKELPGLIEVLCDNPKRGIYVMGAPYVERPLSGEVSWHDQLQAHEYEELVPAGENSAFDLEAFGEGEAPGTRELDFRTIHFTVYSIENQIRHARTKGELSLKPKQGRLAWDAPANEVA